MAFGGEAEYGNGTYTIRGAGSESGRGDATHYVYQTMRGDGAIVARVTTQEDTEGAAKAGVMIRESLGAESRQVSTVVTPDLGIMFEWRSETEGPIAGVGSNGDAPRYVKVERDGDRFRSYWSWDGSWWIQIGEERVIDMPETVYVGLAASSSTTLTANTATFSNWRVE